MPFVSQAQRGFMYANHPELAKEFEAATPKGAKLPEHVSDKKKSSPPPEKKKPTRILEAMGYG
jgi:hypothetical protein